MLDAPLRKVAAPVLVPAATRLARAHMSANALTAASFVAGLGACAAVATHHYWWGLGSIAANRLLAGLGGAAARTTDAGDLGVFLETVLGVIAAASIPFAFALADPGSALAATFLIFSFASSEAALLAFVAVAAKRGMTPVQSRGLIERTETFLALALACAFPDWFGVIAYVLGALCFATAGMRVGEAVVRYREP
ncbi:MAG: CDP-alcohol phosphatidyltransferase family protein [Rhizomicrobium sp.]|jgi:hypothetical protein